MLKDIKNLVKDIFIYGTSGFLTKLIGIFLVPIYTRVFTVAEFGVMETIGTVGAIFSIIAGLGMANASTRYFYEAETNGLKNKILSAGFYILLFAGIILMILIYFLYKPITWLLFGQYQYAPLLLIGVITGIVSIWLEYFKNILRIYFFSRLFAIINFLQSLLSVLLVLVFLFYFSLGLSSIFIGPLIAVIGGFFFLFLYLRRKFVVFYNQKLYKNLFKYGVSFVPAGFAYWIFDLSDRIILSRMVGLEAVGIYSIAMRIVFIYIFFTVAFGLAWSPRLLKMYEEHKKKESFDAFNKLYLYIAVVLGIFAFFITSFAKEFFVIFTAPSFYKAEMIVWLLMFGAFANATAQVTALGISLSKKPRYFFYYSWIAAFVNLGLNILFIPKYGYYAAAFTTALSYFLLTSLYLYRSTKLLAHFNINKIKFIMNFVLFAVFSIVTTYFLNIDNIPLDIFIKVIICGIYLFCVFYLKLINFKHLKLLFKKIPNIA